MSQESRKSAEQGKQHLKQAEEHLQTAGEHFKKAGDGALVKKVAEITTKTVETRREVEQKLGPDAAQKGN